MNSSGIMRWTMGLAMVAWLAVPSSALACAACFGRSDSPMAKGMNMGIMTLLFVIMSVLVGISIFFFYILRRAARLSREQPNTDRGAGLDGSLAQTVSQPTP